MQGRGGQHGLDGFHLSRHEQRSAPEDPVPRASDVERRARSPAGHAAHRDDEQVPRLRARVENRRDMTSTVFYFDNILFVKNSQ